MLRVYSIFFSLQGESTYMGLPCVFIRLAGCDVGCNYCDTTQAAQSPGKSMSIEQVLKDVSSYNCSLVEVTGGEPLQQFHCFDLLKQLCDAGYETLLETSGQEYIAPVDERVTVIMDIKTPGSGVHPAKLAINIEALKQKKGQIKFVVTSKEDFDFAKDVDDVYDLTKWLPVLVSPIAALNLDEVSTWVLNSQRPFRLQLQLHRIIWPGAKTEC